MIQFGVRVRQARTAKGVTQSELGRMLGVSFQQIQKYERGTDNIGLHNLVIMSNVLDVDPNYLLGFDGKADTRVVELNTDTIKLAVTMQDLAAPAKSMCLALINAMKKAGFGSDQGE